MAKFKINVNNEGGVTNPLTTMGVAGEDIFRGTLCYLHTDGKYYKSDATDATKCSTELRVVQENLVADAEGSFISQGQINSLGLTIGVRYYVSTTPGEFTVTKYDTPNIVRYIGTASSSTILEFNPMDISQEAIFFSGLDGSLAIPNEWEENPEGLTISQLQGKTPTQVIETLFFPDVAAYISQNAYTSIIGQSTGNYEVGTSMVHDFDITLHRGNINNGDNTSAGTVVSSINQVNVNDPDGSTEFTENNPPADTVNAVLPAYVLQHGTNMWTVMLTNNVGTTTYTNNKGDGTPITSIENAKADTTRNNVTFYVTGLYKRFHTVTAENNSPSSSNTIRPLTNSLLSSSNTGTWDVGIGAGASNAEFSFYIPQGKTINVIDLGNLNLDVTADFTLTNLTVNDANGTAVNYTKYTRFAGALGFTNSTTFRITVT